MFSKLKNSLLKNLKDKSFWLSNLKTLAIMLVIVFGITQYQQRNMTTGLAPQLESVNYSINYADGPTLVYFWGSWCGICKTTSPSVSTLAEGALQQDSGYKVLSVALSSGSDEEIQQYLTENEYSFSIINDDSGQISQQWGVAVTPSFFVINQQGEITTTSSGMTSLWGMKFRLWLASL